MKTLLSRFRLDQRGATAIEYAMIAGFIAMAIVAVVATVGTTLSERLQAGLGSF